MVAFMALWRRRKAGIAHAKATEPHRYRGPEADL